MSVQERRDADADLETRDLRALQEVMIVLDTLAPAPADAPGLFHVTTGSGSSYVVEPDLGTCECPDFQYRDVRCKHIRRVELELGRRPIPDWVARDRIDDGFQQFVSSEGGDDE